MSTGRELTAYDAQLAKLAEQQQALERSAGREFLSTRAGLLKYQDEELPGNQIAAVIIDAVRENTYYPGKFDPDNVVPPVCYSYGRGSEAEMKAHLETMANAQDYFSPQNAQANPNYNPENGELPIVSPCSGCPMNEWGSADQGSGKACKSKYRLTVLPAGIYEPVGRQDWQLSLFDEEPHYQSATPAYITVPVTSGTHWSDYTRMLRTKYGRPPLGVFTRLYLERHEKHQFHMKFDLIEQVPNELLGVMIERGEQLASEPFRGYDKPSDEEKGNKRGFSRR
jgi:hypothetical protein